MSQGTLRGPSCQSCGMFIMKPTEFGTNATGAIVTEYCRFCFQKGQFLEPGLTMEEMIEKLVPAMKLNRNVTDEQARETARELLSTLKRWQTRH